MKLQQHNPYKILLLFVLFMGINHAAFAQVATAVDSLKRDSLHHVALQAQQQERAVLAKQYDFGNLFHDIFTPHKQPDSLHKPSGITIIPNISANPTIGFQVGVKAVAGRKLGNDPNTFMSVAATSASITTKNIIYFYINHNIYTPGNKWNFQGNIVIAKTVTPDFGLGIGKSVAGESTVDEVLANPNRKVRVFNSMFYNVREKVYKEVAKGLFVGAGASFEVRKNIDEKDTSALTPYKIYNQEHGFKNGSYSANGLLFNLQYTTRDNQNRAYKGIYADVGIRANQSWMGSTQNALQITTDFRKYFSLSDSNPETVLAFWNWGSYLVSGNVPYLELPGTARDGAFRSGRGYTSQYFKGTQFNDTEAEFRFPITANKFLSGVAFGNLQTANDEQGTKLFQVFQPGYGAGLRVLFNKATRTNLALDYAFGKFGNKGFFLNLNEAF
ncbi:BamA/TamA family outer membrane protein [Mucilaginibacter jinjuensis]|uniref:BamA/TamA family outer membrane protein n=1 Tax=Mucilaginibacter jinjuensis TaxID=1176721 RepID=A0ABY7T7P1_9SPHI|nr:BamA/TamA family outer membrane protein [Mucilaginibacter jinjuensis]WCT12500.1 BamA/TamA family outer membrane protein [Mucilaginibacter jinjuensis]